MTQNEENSRVCIVGTIYALMLYLLHSKYEEIQQTYFFPCETISKKITDRLPRVILLPCLHNSTVAVTLREKIFSFLARIYVRFLSCFRWKFLKTADIYAQDHVRYFASLIRKQPYTLLADAPDFLTNMPQMVFYKSVAQYSGTVFGKILGLFVGSLFTKILAHNSQCKRVWLEKKEFVDFVSPDIMEEINMREDWRNSSRQKQELILKIFGITPDLLSAIKSRKVILLTQPLTADAKITESEQIQIYSDLIKNFDQKSIIVKRHPRDKVDYKKYFPDIDYLDTPIPMQFFSVLELDCFEYAVTISSSAVSAFSGNVKIIFAGTEPYPELVKIYGKITLKDIMSDK